MSLSSLGVGKACRVTKSVAGGRDARIFPQ